jgi:magnesium-transporting ATPase (P-type)
MVGIETAGSLNILFTDKTGTITKGKMEVVKVFEKYGWEWGVKNKKGERIDLPHFQKPLGYSTIQLLDKFRKNDFIPGTKYVNI